MTGRARLIEDPTQIFEIGKAVALKYTGPLRSTPTACRSSKPRCPSGSAW